MKSQKHNEGELKEITLKLEVELIKDLKKMAENSGMPENDLVAIALKRFRSSHADYLGHKLDYP